MALMRRSRDSHSLIGNIRTFGWCVALAAAALLWLPAMPAIGDDAATTEAAANAALRQRLASGVLHWGGDAEGGRRSNCATRTIRRTSLALKSKLPTRWSPGWPSGWAFL